MYFVSARVLDDDLNIITLSKEDMEFSYRHSVLQKASKLDHS